MLVNPSNTGDCYDDINNVIFVQDPLTNFIFFFEFLEIGFYIYRDVYIRYKTLSRRVTHHCVFKIFEKILKTCFVATSVSI